MSEDQLERLNDINDFCQSTEELGEAQPEYGNCVVFDFLYDLEVYLTLGKGKVMCSASKIVLPLTATHLFWCGG